MEEKRNNIRPVRTGGRRVTKTTTEYDWNSLERKMKDEKAARQRRQKTRHNASFQKKIRYQKRQKQRRLKMKRRRALVILILIIVLVFILMFVTPIFNIRSVSVDGNRLVGAPEFQEKLKPLVGENLFRSGTGKIRRILKENPYIDNVEIQKKIFPPSLLVTVTEYNPAGLIRVEGKNLIVTKDLRVLSENGEEHPVPIVTGINVESYKIGYELKPDNNEKREIITTALRTMEAVDMLGNVIEFDISDITDITLNYDNRLTVTCGTQLDLDHKLRLLKETVKSLDHNARGTVDLSEPGKAIYIP